jgi:hypothetical protein
MHVLGGTDCAGSKHNMRMHLEVTNHEICRVVGVGVLILKSIGYTEI